MVQYWNNFLRWVSFTHIQPEVLTLFSWICGLYESTSISVNTWASPLKPKYGNFWCIPYQTFPVWWPSHDESHTSKTPFPLLCIHLFLDTEHVSDNGYDPDPDHFWIITYQHPPASLQPSSNIPLFLYRLNKTRISEYIIGKDPTTTTPLLSPSNTAMAGVYSAVPVYTHQPIIYMKIHWARGTIFLSITRKLIHA